MSWEREYHHMNLDEGEHRIGLIDRAVTARNGQPARYTIQIHMGSGAFEHKVGANTMRIKLGGDFTLDENSTLVDTSGNEFDPRAFEKKMIAELNSHHAKLRAYARKHNVPELKAAK